MGGWVGLGWVAGEVCRGWVWMVGGGVGGWRGEQCGRWRDVVVGSRVA